MGAADAALEKTCGGAARRRCTPGRSGTRQRAFTLIEVLAALVIVSLGMMGVIQAVGQSASNGAYLRDKTIAHWVAMNRLAQVRLERAAPRIDTTFAEVEMAGRRWQWRMQVAQTAVAGIRRIDISVRPADAEESVRLASISGFYGTAIAAPGASPISWDKGRLADADAAAAKQPSGQSSQATTTPPGDSQGLSAEPQQEQR